MKTNYTLAEINKLFENSNPEEVWQKSTEIIMRISPVYDFSLVRAVFDDVMRLFSGKYSGYCQIKTPYHDRCHTLDVFVCAVRLMYGVHGSGSPISENDMTLLMIAALMHDVGYAQRVGDERGTGAQYTQIHVNRSIEFMRQYMVVNQLPIVLFEPMRLIILCTNPALKISDVTFSDEHARLLGAILGTADLLGQMADRTYLEKLLLLHLEFEEANFGNYENIHDMLRCTQLFYESTQCRLAEQFGGIYERLRCYFKDWYGVDCNYYQESIDKNITYLEKVTKLNDSTHFSMLKRGGIVDKTDVLKKTITRYPLYANGSEIMDKKILVVEMVACEVCLNEVPITASKTPEAVDYVAHFCGLDCYEKWQQDNELNDTE